MVDWIIISYHGGFMFARRLFLFCSISLVLSSAYCSTSFSANEPFIFEDLGLKNLTKEEKPKSAWIESQKAMFSDFIKDRIYDVMVVPFQVQQYAIDRPGRSLMARYLA
ncbi:MAG: hypothetical protein AAB275_09480, partial [Deltaproteobacteria bacterium]